MVELSEVRAESGLSSIIRDGLRIACLPRAGLGFRFWWLYELEAGTGIAEEEE